MAKKEKVWRVKPEHSGAVTVEKECNHVVLSNDLTQEQLNAFAEDPFIASFMEQVTAQTATNDGE